MWLSQNKGPHYTVTQRRLNRSKCFKSYNLTGWTLKLPYLVTFDAQIWWFSTVSQKVIIWSALRSLRAVYKGSVQPWLGLTCYKVLYASSSQGIVGTWKDKSSCYAYGYECLGVFSWDVSPCSQIMSSGYYGYSDYGYYGCYGYGCWTVFISRGVLLEEFSTPQYYQRSNKKWF